MIPSDGRASCGTDCPRHKQSAAYVAKPGHNAFWDIPTMKDPSGAALKLGKMKVAFFCRI